MNELPCNGLILEAPDGETKNKMYERIWRFVRHFCKYVKSIDSENAVTVGNWLAADIDTSANSVDIIFYHDSSPTLKGVREMAELALSKGKQTGSMRGNCQSAGKRSVNCSADPSIRSYRGLEEKREEKYLGNQEICLFVGAGIEKNLSNHIK